MVDSGSFKTSQNLQTSKHFDNLPNNAILSNSAKRTDVVRRQIDPSVELEQLDVCFGGFSPTVMRDIPETVEGLLRVQNDLKQRREQLKTASQLAQASKSDIKTFIHGSATYKYYLLNGSEVSIAGCECDGLFLIDIPEEIEGFPVVSLEAEAFAESKDVESIKMPDTVVYVGGLAFRDCIKLKKIEYSESLDRYDPSWTRGCAKLEEIKLPGMVDKVTPSVFDAPSLKRLVIGAGTYAVMPGAFTKSQLENVSVVSENEFLKSDDYAIYGADGLALLALAVPVVEYQVMCGCLAVAKKSFSNFGQLKNVELPDTIELIGDYAYAKTGIKEFVAPSSLKAIGTRAFFDCEFLSRVVLNEGLLSIGDHAFTNTAIKELTLPSSVIELGNPLTDGTEVTYAGPNATFTIKEGEGQKITIDESGGIYFKHEDGSHLVRLLDRGALEYKLRPDTVAIDDGAFAKHASLEKAVLNEGLKSIGKGAFKGAKKLTDVNLPSTLELIDDEAFLDTSLEELFIPGALKRIGSVALVAYGAHHGNVEPSLRHIEVNPRNQKYYMESGLLIEHMGNGRDRVILCTGEEPNVRIPDSITAIAPYAFNGVRRLQTLALSDGILAIDVRGLAFDSMLELIHIDLKEPIQGHEYFEFRFPDNSRGAHQMSLAFGSPSFINVEAVFDAYDNSIVSRTGFGGIQEKDNMGAYEQGRRIVERLKEPIFISSSNKGVMDSVIRTHLDEICIDTAKHDDVAVIEGLLDLGFIDEGNISQIIDSVGRIQDASITNYLLEQKKRRFGSQVLDFDL